MLTMNSILFATTNSSFAGPAVFGLVRDRVALKATLDAGCEIWDSVPPESKLVTVRLAFESGIKWYHTDDADAWLKQHLTAAQIGQLDKLGRINGEFKSLLAIEPMSGTETQIAVSMSRGCPDWYLAMYDSVIGKHYLGQECTGGQI